MENILSGNPLLNYSATTQNNDLKVTIIELGIKFHIWTNKLFKYQVLKIQLCLRSKGVGTMM